MYFNLNTIKISYRKIIKKINCNFDDDNNNNNCINLKFYLIITSSEH